MPSPTAPDDRLRLAIQYHQAGRHQEAFPLYRELLATFPRDHRVHAQLGLLLHQHGAHAQAMEHFRSSLEIDDRQAGVWTNYAEAARLLDRLVDAEAHCRRALELNPTCAVTQNNLGLVLYRQGKLRESEAALQRALALAPQKAKTWINLSNVLRDWMRFEEAEAALRTALELDPADLVARSNLLFLLGYRSDASPGELYSEARQWGHRVTGTFRETPLPPTAPFSDRRLRIGYLSPDFRAHSVATFFEPLLAAHDPAAVEVFCYANVGRPDEVTERLRSQAAAWHSIYTLDDASATQLIRSHGLDVLVDLAGHTSGTRLGIFARRAARVQACWLGFFATTGLRTMDYWITDAVLHPPEYDDLFVERLWRLDRCWLAYRPPASAPEPGAPEAGTPVLFGSFNQILKVTPATVRLWSRVLAAVPDSRLLLKTKSLGDSEARDRIRAQFTQEGIASERIELLPYFRNKEDHLAQYNRVDIALDTCPYSGGTTTCEALWMGVPVLTLTGSTMPGRMSTSILHAAGLSSWCAATAEAFVAIAVERSRALRALSTEERKAERRRRREQVKHSSLCDAAHLARALEAAYAGMVTERAG